MSWLRDAVCVIGIGLVAAGLYSYHWALAAIVIGIGLVAMAITGEVMDDDPSRSAESKKQE